MQVESRNTAIKRGHLSSKGPHSVCAKENAQGRRAALFTGLAFSRVPGGAATLRCGGAPLFERESQTGKERCSMPAPRLSLFGLFYGMQLLLIASASAAPTKGGLSQRSQVKEQRIRVNTERSDHVEEQLYFRAQPQVPATHKRPQAIERMLQQREALRDQRRLTALGMLRNFVRREPERSPLMPEALLRLGELEWEYEHDRYLKSFQYWQNQSPSTRAKTPPQANYNTAIATYDRILIRHTGFERYDLALFLKAYALAETGHNDQALAHYQRILQEFPQSSYVPDAHMAHAEALFTRGESYNEALASYNRVLSYPKNDLYGLALFKSAWCLWKLGQTKDAAMRFRQVLDLGEKGSHRDLRQEAFESIVALFTENEKNTSADIHGFLAHIGGQRYAKRVLLRVSEIYFDQARFEDSVNAYKLLLERYPESPEAPLYQHHIAEGYLALGDRDQATATWVKMADMIGSQSAWRKRQVAGAALDTALILTERTLREEAQKAHKEGQEHNQAASFESARLLYAAYLRHFVRTKARAELSFFYGELLFHRLKRYEEAGDAYMMCVNAELKGKLTRTALYNAIASYEKVREAQLQECAKTSRVVSPQGAARQSTCPETANDRKFSAAIATYVALFPTDPDIPEILFRQGKLYYDRGVYDSAVRLFGQLLEKYPNSSVTPQAGELILESFQRAQDYSNIELWARRLKQAPAFAAPQSQTRLNSLILQASFKKGEQYAASGKHAQAAQAYYAAAQEFPKDTRAPEAYYNAGLERQRAGDLEGSAQAYDRLVERYPTTTVAAQGAWTAAKMFESIALFDDAAKYYNTYATRLSKADKRADALYNAVVLHLASGNHAKANESAKHFLKEFPEHAASAEVTFLNGQAYEQAGQPSKAAEVYRKFIARNHALEIELEARVRLAQALYGAKQTKAAEQAIAEAIHSAERQRKKLSPQAKYFLAQAKTLNADRILAEFRAIEIAGPTQGLSKRLTRKSELLREAALAYADVVELRAAVWATAALYKIGRSYELFADSLRNAPVPKGLNETEQQAYREQLESFIVPVEEKALQAYDNGYRKALSMQIYNAWTQKLREGLTRLNDVAYPPLRESGTELGTWSTQSLPQPLGTALGSTDGQYSKETPTPSRERR